MTHRTNTIPKQLLAAVLGLWAGLAASAGAAPPVCIGGVYPHLAVTNAGGGECGIGAVMPWAGKLWWITYPAHAIRGSSDKLYAIDENLNLEVRPESVGGTHAGRLIHRESNQLFIGPYAIDAHGKVRAMDVKQELVGRMTAVARHLTDPANRVYYYDMEGALYEVNVHTLAVGKLVAKAPIGGTHGKGGYTGQGRLILANNAGGGLGEWDGSQWRILHRSQFTDVTGPGGVLGAPDDKSPIWCIGWDHRSVILILLDAGTWHTYRLPKANRTYDQPGGWYTEWPRIREVGPGRYLMDVHGMFYEFPKGFCSADTGGLRPIASHLRMVPDFCGWNGRLVLATDETTTMQNPMAGRSWSNLWFGQWEDLAGFGPRSGRGGPWVDDPVEAGKPSEPYLANGFDHRVLHLWHNAAQEVTFTVEFDADGKGVWRKHADVTVPAAGYRWHVFPDGLRAQWVRLVADRDCRASAVFHYGAPVARPAGDRAIFAALADAGQTDGLVGGLIRPGPESNLQYLRQDGSGKETYFEVNEKLDFLSPESKAEEVRRIASVRKDFEADAASVILSSKQGRLRLPRGPAVYDQPMAGHWPRGIRECETERWLANIHGTFYLIGRQSGLPAIQPVCSHRNEIMDFCTWRGLLVLSGTHRGDKRDGHYFGDGTAGLWFGQIDDLWKLGKPVGTGGPWKQATVRANEPSDPYLMVGYDKKTLELSHNLGQEVRFAIEVEVLGTLRSWLPYATIAVPAGKPVRHEFPAGFSAHWVRVRADKPCAATAWFVYE